MTLDQTDPTEIVRLQVIFKTVERCNLACPYCYYFFSGDDSYKQRPARTNRNVIDQLCHFLAEGARDLAIRRVQVAFHGGEPMLQRPQDFAYACESIRSSLGAICEVGLNIQTNGTRISAEWVDMFAKYGVGVGVSMDGDREAHDKNRFHHNGAGSYDEIVAGLQVLREHRLYDGRGNVGVLAVLDAQNDYGKLVRHFVDELGFSEVNFLLPDCTHDDGIPNGLTGADYGRALCQIFDAWSERPEVDVREVSDFLRRFQRATLSPAGAERRQDWSRRKARVIGNQIIVVQSDGELKVDDSYMPASEWRKSIPSTNIRKISLKSFLEQPIFRYIEDALERAPTACRGCEWLAICGGGSFENRYSSDRMFDNPSVFCEALKIFYEHGVSYLVRNGYPPADIYRRLQREFAPGFDGYAA